MRAQKEGGSLLLSRLAAFPVIKSTRQTLNLQKKTPDPTPDPFSSAGFK